MKRSRLFRAVLGTVLILCMLMGMLPASFAEAVQADAEAPAAQTAESAVTQLLTDGDWLYRVCEDGNAELTGYADPAVTSLKLPQSVDGLWVVRLSRNAFADNAALRRVDIPASIGQIPDTAFPHADALTVRARNGSTAMRFASARHLAFESLSSSDFLDDVLDMSEIKRSQWSLSGSTLTLGMPWCLLLEDGAKLYLPPDDRAPAGLAVRVEAVSATADSATARVSELDFTELMGSLHLENERMRPDYDHVVILSEGVVKRDSGSGTARSTFTSDTAAGCSFDINIPISKYLSIEGTVSYTAGMTVSLDYSSLRINSADFDITETQGAELTLKAAVGSAIPGPSGKPRLDVSAKGFERELFRIPFTCGTPLLTVYASAKLFLELDGSVSIKWEQSRGYTISFRDGKSTCTSNESQPVAPTWSGAVNGSCGLEIGLDARLGLSFINNANLSLKFAEITGRLSLDFSVEASYLEELPCCFDLSTYGHFQVKASIGILNGKRSNDSISTLMEDMDEETRPGFYPALTITLVDQRIPLEVTDNHWEGPLSIWTDRCQRDDYTCIATFDWNFMDVIDHARAKRGAPFVYDYQSVINDLGRVGYSFVDWYTDPAFTNVWDRSMPATEDVTFYAKWKKEDQPTPTDDPDDPDPDDPDPDDPDPTGSYKLGFRRRGNVWDSSYIELVAYIEEGDPTYVSIPAYSYYYDGEEQQYPLIVKWVDLSESQSLKSFDYPDTVNYIICNDCESLERAVIPSNGAGIFSGCTSLKSVRIPEGNKVIISDAFSGCTSLTSVKLPSTLEQIMDGAFSGCTSLTSVKLPSALESIGDSAFYGCSSLSDVNFPRSLRRIGYKAFSETAIVRADLPDGITEMNYYAFADCPNLVSIHIPSGLGTEIDISLANDVSLKEVTIPTGVTRLDGETFRNCSSLESVSLPSGLTEIFSSTFNGCTSLKSITLPSGLETLGGQCFEGCSSLEKIDIPGSVTSIGPLAFMDCTSLASVTMTGNRATIDYRAFSGCSSLASMDFLRGAKAANGNIFYGCASLEKVLWPDNVELFGPISFYGCSSLRCLELPERFDYLITRDRNEWYQWLRNNFWNRHPEFSFDEYYPDDWFFTSDYYGTRFKAGDYWLAGTAYLERYAFSGCPRLRTLRLPEGLTSIPFFGLYGGHFENLSLPSTLVAIDEGGLQAAFINEYDTDEESYKTLILPDGLRYIGVNAISDNPSLRAVHIPDSCESIAESAFHNCGGLEEIRLPRSITTIEAETFWNCIPKTLIIHDSVTSIADDAFTPPGSYLAPVDTGMSEGGFYYGPESIYVDSLDGYVANWARSFYPDAMLIPIDAEDPVVTFNAMGGSCETAFTRVKYGETAVAPNPDPVHEEYDFLGWFADPDCQVPWDFGTRIDRDTTLYAGWGILDESFDYYLVGDGAYVNYYLGKAVRLTIPGTLDGHPVIGLAEGAVPDTVTRLTLPGSITWIDSDAFRFAYSLCEIHVAPGSPYSSRDGVLFRDTTLIRYPAMRHSVSYAVPSDVTDIADCAFQNVSRLASLNLSASVDRIGEHAIQDCPALEKITFQADPSYIGQGNFQNCESLYELSGPVGATELEAYADENEFDYNTYMVGMIVDGAVLAVLPQRAGSSIKLPVLEDTDTLLFVGWAYDPDGENMCQDSVMPSRHMLLYAIYGSEFEFDADTQTLTRYNGTRTTITVPLFVNNAWVYYIADDCFPDESVTLVGERGSFVETYANEKGMTFIALKRTLSFESEGGTPIPSMLVEVGQSLDNKPIPVREGYDFTGWTKGYSGSGNYEYSMPNEDLTLYANWSRSVYYDDETGESYEVEAPDYPFTFIAADGGLEITGYTGTGGEVVVPEAINDLPVVSIGDAAFLEDSSIESVTLPECVTRVGSRAFEGSSVTRVALPGVTSIGARAFRDCKLLTQVSLPDALSGMGDSCFSGCAMLRSIALPEGLDTLPDRAFRNCVRLSEVVLPGSLETIGDSAFSGCKALSALSLGAEVGEIAQNAFDSCAALQTIDVAAANPYYSSVDGVLFNKSGNTLIRYPEGKSDSAYTVAAGVTLIARGAMRNSRLQSLTLGADVLTLAEDALANVGRLSTLALNDGLEEIGECAFSGCLALKEVELPGSVAAIGAQAFSQTGLVAITIGEDTRLQTKALPQNDRLTIYGVSGSDAQRYAGEYNIRFVDLAGDVPVTGIRLDESTLALELGESRQLRATLEPDDTTETDILWISTDNAVARVDETGLVLARKAGTADIVAIAANGSEARCRVVVAGGEVPEPVLTYDDIDISKADLVLPEFLEVIDDYAFYGIDAEFVVIPANCSQIGYNAFANCQNLRIVYFLNGDSVSVDPSFLEGSDQAVVYAPRGSALDGWTAD